MFRSALAPSVINRIHPPIVLTVGIGSRCILFDRLFRTGSVALNGLSRTESILCAVRLTLNVSISGTKLRRINSTAGVPRVLWRIRIQFVGTLQFALVFETFGFDRFFALRGLRVQPFGCFPLPFTFLRRRAAADCDDDPTMIRTTTMATTIQMMVGAFMRSLPSCLFGCRYSLASSTADNFIATWHTPVDKHLRSRTSLQLAVGSSPAVWQ
ncbi:hypothetical protein [Brevibacterium siliguriense]|uniref:hypothetical protein n=1 Tax=Brevibacterium siliguriense TaxID=1136497 RepID=UPI000B870929|nr:hypothetical protein [Brevibacterium siliguriense]